MIACGMVRFTALLMILGCQDEATPRTFAQSDSDETCDDMMDLLCSSCEAAGVYSFQGCIDEVNCEAVKRTYGDVDDCITALRDWDCGSGVLPFDCYGALGF